MPPKAGSRDTRYLIVGNSAGGIGAVEAIREVDADGLITIVSDEPYPAYSRPEISEYLAGLTTVERMLFRPADFYEERRKPISALPPPAGGPQNNELDDGRVLAWERLLLATGGHPTVPPIPGADRQNVFTFTTLADADRIRAALKPGCRAVVIGAGLIGLSLTHALVRLSVPVVMVELLDRPLANALDREAAGVVEDALRKAGVELAFGQTVAEVLGRPEDDRLVGGVRLQDGRQLPCDILAIAIGVTPRTELASGAGLRVNRGIVVDRRMAASHPDVYACGDAAEAFDFVHGVERVTPIWPDASLKARGRPTWRDGRQTRRRHGHELSQLLRLEVSAGLQEPGESDTRCWRLRAATAYQVVLRTVALWV
jgi:NAD(P)H-nitrite reductase large subunit